jgi:peptide/nickel transport system ATP-binding protein
MTALNPVMRCGAQVDEVLRTHTRLAPAERRDRVLAVMHEVGLPEPERLSGAYPHEISGGQRQRIMIAMALALDPALLIADEPTTALDVTTQAQILRLVRELQARHGTGVLFITHDFGVVAETADRVAVMRAGRVVETGTRDEVLRRPRDPYTRLLIAAVPSLTPRHRAPAVRRDDRQAAPVLRTAGLGKVYGSERFLQRRRVVPAAEEVSLEVRRGEVLGIVGESGSGKSTVARCVARLLAPSSGEVWLGSDEIGRLPLRRLHPHRRRIQLVFQDPYRSLNPRRTVGASIVEGPMNYGVASAEAWRRAEELMGLVRLDPDSLGRYPHQFSGGQRQRICIARALAMEPELLIADEAVSALDVSVQAQVLRLLDQVRERLDLAMLFITHDLRVAAQICDRVAVMHRGRIVEQGEAAEIFASTAPRVHQGAVRGRTRPRLRLRRGGGSGGARGGPPRPSEPAEQQLRVGPGPRRLLVEQLEAVLPGDARERLRRVPLHQVEHDAPVAPVVVEVAVEGRVAACVDPVEVVDVDEQQAALGQHLAERAQVEHRVEQAQVHEDGVRVGLRHARPGQPVEAAVLDDVDGDVGQVRRLARADGGEVVAHVEAVEVTCRPCDRPGHEAAAAAEVGHHVGLADPQPRHDLGRVAAPLLADLLDPLLRRLPEPPADEQPQHLPVGLEAPGLAQASTPPAIEALYLPVVQVVTQGCDHGGDVGRRGG